MTALSKISIYVLIRVIGLAITSTAFFRSTSHIHTKSKPCLCFKGLSSTAVPVDLPLETECEYVQPQKSFKYSPPSAIYIHIPYCRRRCRYCDFSIVPVGDIHASSNEARPSFRQSDGFYRMDAEYRNSILQELHLLAVTHTSNQTLAKSQPQPSVLNSIYFGGGTPSLAPLETLQTILSAVITQFPCSPETEITLEMDPGSFNLEYLHSVKRMGFNRVSLGVQSFNDTILAHIGRTHRYQDIVDSLSMLREVGLDNYSLDLISGLPGVSKDAWADTLKHALVIADGRGPPHLSTYDLQIESNTVFDRWYSHFEAEDDDDDEDDDETDYIEENQNGGLIVEQKVDTNEMPTANFSEQTEHFVETPVSSAPPSVSSKLNSNSNSSLLFALPNAKDSAYMYKYTSKFLKNAGYEHYEISSYARRTNTNTPTLAADGIEGKYLRSKHNANYWGIGSSWHAIGLGATSFIMGKRYARPKQMSDYIKWTNNTTNKYNLHRCWQQQQKEDNNISHQCNNQWVPPWLPENSNNDSAMHKQEDNDELELEILDDIVMKRLRTSDGLDMSFVWERYGAKKVEAIFQGAELAFDLGMASLLQLSKNNSMVAISEKEAINIHCQNVVLRLTDPDGFLFSNTIISSIFVELDT